MKSVYELYLNQDNLVKVNSAKSPVTNKYLNDGSGEVYVKTKSGTVLAGPIPLEYINDSNGDYAAIIPIISGVFSGQRVNVEITLQTSDGWGDYGSWTEPAIFEIRNSNDSCQIC